MSEVQELNKKEDEGKGEVKERRERREKRGPAPLQYSVILPLYFTITWM